MTDSVVLEVENLHHSFKRHKALDGVSFKVRRNSIHGFVGPNGAGKTTTLKIVATLLVPKHGGVKVFDQDVVKDYKSVRKRIGFMPDHFSMYRQMTVFEYLDFFAAAYGLELAERDKVIGDVLTLTDMEGRKNDAIKQLSRGMCQRVSLARVLVHDPDLLLLDEPASGLDPRARVELMEILRELRGMGKTIFISSHILSELADLCDSVTILDVGRVKFSGSMEDLQVFGLDESAPKTFRLAVRDSALDLADRLRRVEGIEEVESDEENRNFKISFRPDAVSTNDVLSAAIAAGVEVVGFREDTRHLNQAFMDLTSAGVRAS